MRKSRKRRRERKQAGGSQATVKPGDSVVVKPGTLDPDFSVDIGGWQGRILEGPGVDDMVLIAWDSVTLQHTPASVIEQSEQQGLDWTQMPLAVQDVELARPRDTEVDVARTIDELSRKYAWSFLGEEGKRVGKIMAGVDQDDEMAALDVWEEHLTTHLVFPFEAEIDEYQERGPLQAGDRVRVKEISGVDDLYGIIVRLTKHRRRYDCLLCELKVIDEDSPNYQLVNDYRAWFANR